MSRLLAASRRLALAVAAVALVASWTASGARAEVAYAYAEQTISNLVADAGVTLVPPIPAHALSQTAANLNGTGTTTTVNGPDAPQSYVGTPPKPPENSFVKYATFASAPPIPAGELPTAPAASFSRGDVLLSGTSGSAVAETYLNGAGQVGGADGNNHITYTFTATAGTHTITFDYANDLYAAVKNPAADVANATFSFSVKLTGGGLNEFLTVPAATNSTLTVPPNQPEVINSGTGATVTTPELRAGVTYSITFSLDANTNAATGVPEPATMAMALTALPLLGLGLVRRHRNRKVQA